MESEENKNVLEVVKKLLVKKNQIQEKWPNYKCKWNIS